MPSEHTNCPALSLCMIIKNEEDYLPICLESVKDLVDEIIIVDTGSTDVSVEIAKNYGAQVFFFEWNNDFSAARNESIKHATGDWILYLDADERILPEDKLKIRTIITNENITAVNLRVVIPQPPGNVIKSYAIDYCRLFRNHPDILFEGTAHEQVLPAIYRLGGLVHKSDIIIDHWGHNTTRERRQAREERNLKILTKEMESAPSDPFVHYNLGLTHRFLGNIKAAIYEFIQVLIHDHGNLKKELVGTTYTFLAQAYLAQDDYEQAWQNSLQAIQLLPEEPLPYYLLATTAFSKQQFDVAIQYLEQIIEIVETRDSSSRIAEIDLAQIFLDLGNCFYIQRNPEKAISNYDKALERAPDSLDVNFNLGNCYFMNGQYHPAREQYKKALSLNPAFEAARVNLEKCEQIH